MAEVFIGIPTLNRPDLMRETLASVLEQTFGDFRVMVSDNQSDPAAAQAAENHVRSLGDPRVGFHRQPRNMGEYGQGWYFLKEAREPFCIILHDDDLLEKEYLARACSALRRSADLAYFVANARLVDRAGRFLEEQTREYQRASGHLGLSSGSFDVMEKMFPSPSIRRRLAELVLRGPTHGFTPISGTCFRTAALRASGFVDDDCFGNYPFEFNVLMRLCDRRARAWFCAEDLIRFRVHDDQLWRTLKILDNPHIVDTFVRLLERRTYQDGPEAARRVLLARYLRARARLRIARGEVTLAREDLRRALALHPGSPKAAAILALALMSPGVLRSIWGVPGAAPAPPPLFDEDFDRPRILSVDEGTV